MAVSIESEAILLTKNTLVCHMVNINVSLFKHAENWIEQLTYNSHTSFAEYKIASLIWTEDILTISNLHLPFRQTFHSLKYIALPLFLGLLAVLSEHILSIKALLMIWFFLQQKSCRVFPIHCQRLICCLEGFAVRRPYTRIEKKLFWNICLAMLLHYVAVRPSLGEINSEQLINCDHTS